MNKKLVYALLFGFLGLGSNAQAQVSKCYKQLHIGRLLPQDSVRIFIEYPEFEKLGKQDILDLQHQGFVPGKEVRFSANYSVSRGHTVADVCFFPVVKRNGVWLKVKDYTLKYEIQSANTSPSLRQSQLKQIQVEAAGRYASHSVLAQGKWVKIRVTEEGIYQLTDRQLVNMGFNNPSKVKLYGYGGRLLPEKFSFQGDEALIDDLNEVPLYRREGSVVFFAEGLTRWLNDLQFQTNTFSKYSYYFLTEGESPLEWKVLSPSMQQGTLIDQVPAYALFDNDAFTWYGGGRDFYDSKDTQGAPVYELLLPGNVGGLQEVVYDISAKASIGTTTVSISKMSSNGVGTDVVIRHDGELAKGYRGTFQTQMGERERFSVRTSNTGRLNYIYTCYTQRLSALHTTHAFTTKSKGFADLSVGNADQNTRVWQLGNANQTVVELPGSLKGTDYVAQTSDARQRFVVVDIAKQYPSPEVVGTIENQDLHADTDIDYVMIVPASGKLIKQAERLAEEHRSKGMTVKVVAADKIFNEFSSGTPDATAYRRYLKMLYDRAVDEQHAPKYLLLFGDCSYDNRMITPELKRKNPDDYLLAYERSDQEKYMNTSYVIGTMNNYVTDDYFALLDDNEGENITSEKIDLGIGRFLCHDEATAELLVDKTLSYLRNEVVGAWKNRMWAIGDVGDENLHMDDALEVSRMIRKYANPGFFLRYNFPDVYTVTAETKGATYPEATQNLKRAMKQGALIFNYNGHGSPDRLSHQFLLDKDDMTANVSQTSPIWIFASCEITPYDQAMDDLGRNALYNRNGGAVAVLCAARSVYANYNRSLNMGFVKYAFQKDADNKRYTLGDALRLTKLELIGAGGGEIGMDKSINKLKYVLLGDPALTLAYPETGVRIDSVNGLKVKENNLTELPIGDVVRFSGYVHNDANPTEADTTFNGTLTGTVFTPQQEITCKGYGNKHVDQLQFEDYTQLLFEGSVEVNKGRFTLEFMVPRGIVFSKEKALLSLYAVESESHKEYNGRYTDFCFNGSSAQEQLDSIGPHLYMYMNAPDFPNGAVVSPAPTLYVSISDSSAISMVSGSMGHDMELWLDNDLSTLQVVNDYFSFDFGSYQKGLLEYPLEFLTPGRHALFFRAWDVYDNSSTSRLDFTVREGGAPQFDVTASTGWGDATVRFITTFDGMENMASEIVVEVYNIAGYRVWHQTKIIEAGKNYAAFDWKRTDYAGNRLNRGVYLYRSKVNKKETDTKKIVFP